MEKDGRLARYTAQNAIAATHYTAGKIYNALKTLRHHNKEEFHAS